MYLAQLSWIAQTVVDRTANLDTAMRALAGRPAHERFEIGHPIKIRFAEQIHADAKQATKICREATGAPAAFYYTITLLRVINEIIATARDDNLIYRVFLTDQISKLRICADDIEGAIRFCALIEQRTGDEEWTTGQ
jgi:hypothetical protein